MWSEKEAATGRNQLLAAYKGAGGADGKQSEKSDGDPRLLHRSSKDRSEVRVTISGDIILGGGGGEAGE